MIREFRKQARRILELAGEPSLQVFLRTKQGALVRFTNNGVHQNGFQDIFLYTLRLIGKTGPVWVESNDLSEEGIRRAIDQLRLDAEIPVGSRMAAPPLKIRAPRGTNLYKGKEYFSFDLKKIPAMAAQTIEKAVRAIRAKQASANGYYSAYQRFFYLADAKGLEAFHPATAFRFGLTATKGVGKGYFSTYHPDPRKLNVSNVVEEALRISGEASSGEVKVEPGEYECIFSPRALLEFIEPLRRHFDRRLYEDKKSIFSRRLGEEIFSKHFTLSEDCVRPGQFGLPFDTEGAPRKKVTLVERGTFKDLLAEGHSTRGLAEHPFYPQNLVIEKGNESWPGLLKKIRRGIFINKVWYHALVREREMEVTGLATAGSLYIEGGRVRGRTAGLRYHDSLFSVLRSVAGASREQVLLKDGEMGAALFPYLWVARLRVV